ncbi:MAG: hydrogenase maturation protease, partial [Dehalococcoidia bacterium]|nr:hydrogenase maturation protease [Dehalococcoidia bacterium]
MSRRVLVAGMGNTLRGDDGFGIEVVRRLRNHPALPPWVSVIESGIAGVSLAQDLLDGYEGLIIVDTTSTGGVPGTLVALEPDVPEVTGASGDDPGGGLGDPHTTTPSRVLLLARALGALPRRVVIVGCEPLTPDALEPGLSAPVAS